MSDVPASGAPGAGRSDVITTTETELDLKQFVEGGDGIAGGIDFTEAEFAQTAGDDRQHGAVVVDNEDRQGSGIERHAI